jgi:hypothetical protein
MPQGNGAVAIPVNLRSSRPALVYTPSCLGALRVELTRLVGAVADRGGLDDRTTCAMVVEREGR